LLNWLELDTNSSDEKASIVLAPIWGKGEDSDKLNKWLGTLRKRRAHAEEKRLFYVACTRAREELHLFAACKQNANGELTPPASGTLLKACWPAAQEHFLALQTSTAPPAAIRMPQPIDTEPLALAAGAEEPAPAQLPPPILQRLPLDFDPIARFNIPAADRLLYPAAASLLNAPAFDRPEGSFAVRAFGNVVHRFLQLIIQRLETGLTPDALLAELPEWQPRLFTVLRAEGLAPTVARRDALRALQALQQSLADPEGRWLLSPRTASTTEQALTSSRLQDLRADRTFFAGPAPLAEGNSTYWIVDFKTTTERSLSPQDFEAAEFAKYRAQLETYACIRRGLLPPDTAIRLALYYPLLPRLIHRESLGE
jgi:ATP-dependent exoDNAse (exonuclease V) beta subunit